MRPRGEISITVVRCLAQRGSATFVEVAHAVQIGRRTAQLTLENLKRAGLAEVFERRPHERCNRPLNVWRLCAPSDTSNGLDVLQQVMQGFVSAARSGL